TVDTTILMTQKKNPSKRFYENDVSIKLINKKSNSIDLNEFNKEFSISTQIWNSEKSFLIRSNSDEIKIIQKIDQNFNKLESFAEMFSGIKCYEVGKGNPPQTPQIMIRDILKFPIPNYNSVEVENHVNNLQKQTSNLIKLKSKFLGLLQDNLALSTISRKLAAFYESDLKSFLSELKKQKTLLSLSDQSEWKDFFEHSKSEINQLQSEIEKTDREIDQMVYELYGLTKEEIKIVEGEL
ncbi:MAG: hypothetical protein WC131_04080, partial [Bacilli bacterium]